MIKTFIVEDEPLVRRGILSMMPLARYGMELVGEASSGEEALEALRRLEVDVLFADISMPGMSGLELLSVVGDQYPGIQFVVLTCHQEFDYLQQALRLGAIDYMVKTQLDDESVEELLGRIAKRFERQAGQSAAGDRERLDINPHKDELTARWNTLQWMVDDRIYEQLLSDSLLSFQPADWFNMLRRAQAIWLEKCPLLDNIRVGSLWPREEAAAGLTEGLSEFRAEAQKLLRSTMLSEEVIHSVISAVDMLHQQMGERTSQSEICKAINMSISYFSRCFKEIMGCSFVSYVQHMNIRQAQHLLQTTNFPIYRVAEMSGFEDEKYFGKIFRLKTGFTPSEFRLQYRENK
ncbi:response regulator [Paenibacillus sp. GCM10027626]|uniref:response regulator transcription factor n=1 Tax=Paenibacillus sp. GCM10027626 TaxID=3273411 RepID=UPI0036324688